MKVFDLKRFRSDKKITQNKLTTILECTQSFISAIESGKRTLPQDKIDILEKKYGNISDYIITKGKNDISIQGVTSMEMVEIGGEVYANLLNKLIKEKQLAPFALLEQKEQEIKELNREIGRLEERIENIKKMDAQGGDNAICAVAK